MSISSEGLLEKAQKHHKRKNSKLAEQFYRRVIALKPQHPIALNNLATILIERGDQHGAIRLLNTALRAHSSYVDCTLNLAICHGMLRQWEKCLKLCVEALSLQPDSTTALLWRARSEAALGDSNSARQRLEDALLSAVSADIKPIATEYLRLCSESELNIRGARTLIETYPNQSAPNKCIILEALHEAALSHERIELFDRCITRAVAKNHGDPWITYWHAKNNLRGGREREAIIEFMQVVQKAPNHDNAWLELGLILKKQKNLFKAIECLKRASRENPDNRATWQELINCLLLNKEYREAMRQSAIARKRFHEDPNILLLHCHALLDGGRPSLAHSFLKNFIGGRPQLEDSSLLNCKGLVLLQQGLYPDALQAFRRATKIANADAGIWNNRGMAYGLAGRSRPEISCYRRAILCNPDDPGSHVNLAMALLAKQDFTEGLREYEWRLKSDGGGLNVPVGGTIFNDNDAQPEELLVVSEQGLGDTFHFCRYLYDLSHRLPKTRLLLACPDKLKKILQGSFKGIATVIGDNPAYTSAEEYSYLPLMSLPHFCGIHPHLSRAPKSYLRIEDEVAKRAKMAVRDSSHSSLVIGINWKGNPETERSNLKGRSMKLEQMKILADELPTAAFVSLQKGLGTEELDNCSFRDRFIVNQDFITKELCFSFTAGVCMACDHVVTTDTSLAHLAGAIGQSTKVLLTRRPEWRWRGNNTKSPWYAKTDHYYQTSSGLWLEPLSEVARSIREKKADCGALSR